MFKFESIIESLVEMVIISNHIYKKMQKSKSVNNDKELQKEELTQQIICFIEKIIENTIQAFIRPIEEQLRSQETQILQLQSQFISLHHPFSPKNKEIVKVEKLDSPMRSNEIQSIPLSQYYLRQDGRIGNKSLINHKASGDLQ
ncbi:unnamed protein product (macronuclear) [Paramecium tetraurelia]|uniref:Uncharacterized protein n=1 Tax=Paramecium tetraurelia TaxID=5888 RepID=A0CHH9_PARTE|nr:uncharacterized protein GSPATT00038348001 [Paramecium tetraurelia]CAK70246.1 unnamed protein product [Paramecium tetraurelia]|eukprot:XP_001437643.1 hypothetical protein (macronuclear) [Paramecium tetraurelia strain d4-2]